LDYSAYTSDIYVNQASDLAMIVGGGIANFQNVIGGTGNPQFEFAKGKIPSIQSASVR